MAGTIFWHCQDNDPDTHDFNSLVEIVRANGNRRMSAEFPNKVTVVSGNDVCWMLGLAKGSIIDDLDSTISFRGANGATLWIYGYKEPTIVSGLVLLAIVRDGSKVAQGDKSHRLKLVPRGGDNDILYSDLCTVLDKNTQW